MIKMPPTICWAVIFLQKQGRKQNDETQAQLVDWSQFIRIDHGRIEMGKRCPGTDGRGNCVFSGFFLTLLAGGAASSAKYLLGKLSVPHHPLILRQVESLAFQGNNVKQLIKL